MHVEYWFDFSCPYAYVGSEVIEDVCARIGATLSWRPMLLGGVFRAIGAGEGPMATLPAIKAQYTERDVRRWAERREVSLTYPAGHPIRTVRALRVLLGLPEATWPAAIHAIYRAYWAENVDITRDDVLATVLGRAGVDARAAIAGAGEASIKDALRRRTDEAVARGVFGAPGLVVDGVLLWGQDRLHWLEAIAAGWRPDDGTPPTRPPADRAALAPPGPGRVVDFWFDFSSPFAYLGATQIDEVCRAAGATLRWKPVLLGALFKEIGTADVPLFAMPEPKRRYVAGEMERWARWWSVPFRMAPRFPIRTVTALRMVIASGMDRALIDRLFRAAWVDGEDLGDDATLRRIAGPALVDAAADPAIKQALFERTTEARQTGVFGVPTCVVHDPAGPLVFWGQDRLDLVAAAARGWRPTGG